MRLRPFTRLAAAAGALLLAAPALGQADLAAVLTLSTESDPRTAGIPVGGSRTFKVTVTNNGPEYINAFRLSVTKDAALEYPKDTAGKMIPVTGCAPVATTQPDPFPCTVTIDNGLLLGGSTSISFNLEYPAPDPLNPGTAACPSNPGPAPAFVTTVTVSNGEQTQIIGTPVPKPTLVPVTDPTAGNDSASVTTHLRDWADLQIVKLTGPANASEGQQVTYTVDVNNIGPCDAKRVRVPFNFPASLSFVSSTTCLNTSLGDDGFCTLGTIAKGASPSFTATFVVNTFPKSVIKAAIPVDVSIVSRSLAAAAPAPAEPATDDPNADNDAASTQATVDLSGNEGCSTGGAGTLLALLPLLALRFGRRRTS